MNNEKTFDPHNQTISVFVRAVQYNMLLITKGI